MKVIKHLVLLGLALLAAYMAKRALKRLKPETEIIGLLWALIGMTATSSLDTAKARSTEARLASVVVQVGGVNNTATNAQALAGNALPKAGGTVTGSLGVNGNHSVGGALAVSGGGTFAGNVDVGNQVNAYNFAASGATSDYGHTTHGSMSADSNVNAGGNVNASGSVNSATLYVSGQRIAPGQGTPGGYPVSGSPSNAGLGTLCNQIISGLQAAGIFS